MLHAPGRAPRASRLQGLVLVAGILALGFGMSESAAGDDRADERRAMVAEIAADARATESHTGRASFDERVMAAMARVPRHRFVPDAWARAAYDNRPLPIGEDQTISQPYIVALSTDLIDPGPDDVVLEVGTGSGYQAAVLAELVREVWSIEIIEPLGRQAARLLDELGYDNVEVRIGDGYRGWPEKGPFDAIIVTAAAPEVPPPLVEQLKPGAKMVIPVGSRFATQELLLVEKLADGRSTRRTVLPVRFVPLTRDGDG
ncbi:MAG: protein-L-isoaspartate(D-aspartate) O-methyltransferase [Burkholderiaceae bacterium]